MRFTDDRLRTRGNALLVTLALTLGLAACQGLSDGERETVMKWLTCDECTDGELQAVVGPIGDRASPLLREALVEPPQEYLDNAERALGAAWTRRDAPAVDSAEYVDFFLANYTATLQRRAAIALGALGRIDILEDAYEDRALIGYRSDVEAVIADELVKAGGGGSGFAPPQATSVIVRPGTARIELDSTVNFEGIALDAGGRMLSQAIDWQSSAPDIASVASPALGLGRVVGHQLGTATITATVGSVVGQAVVTVAGPSSPPWQIRILSGNAQVVEVGRPLVEPLVVEVVDGTGTERSGVTVTFEVARGSANPLNASVVTDATGRASLNVTLGSTPGLIWIDATASGLPAPSPGPGPTVRFQIRAINQ